MKMQQQQLHLHLHQARSDNPAAMSTFNQVSLDKSKSFIKALQELKNLRPQLYSAAEYCEKSYLNSEQKQMVLDNLKDYAVRALVNAVDHLGTVAYKLTDVLEQQTVDISTMELKVSCVNQQILTSQTYMNKEGLRQQELLAIIPRHHKHYTLPNIVNKKVHFSPLIHTNSRQNQNHSRLRLQPSATPAAKTLSWHLASETKSTLKGSSRASIRMDMDGSKSSGKSPGVFHLWDGKESTRNKHPATHLQLTGGGSASSASMLTSSVTPKHSSSEGNKHMTPFRSFGSPVPREIARAPVRSKSMMSAFFAKQKTQKLKTSAVS